MTPKQLKNVQAIIETTTAEFIRNLPNILKTRLEQAALRLIGLSINFGEVKIDHCNGNKGIIGEAIETRTKEAVTKMVNPAIDLILDTLSSDPKVAKAIEKDLRNTYTYYFRNAAEEAIKARATADAQKFVDELDELNNVKIGPQNTDIDDPKSFSGPLGQIFMEETVLKMLKKD